MAFSFPPSVVDLGMTKGLDRGHRWRPLLEVLATCVVGKPARVHVTGVGACLDTMRDVGRELEACSEKLAIRFELYVNLMMIMTCFGIRASCEVLTSQKGPHEVGAAARPQRIFCRFRESHGLGRDC